ncbi:anaerobic C4-dicarboxylate transporter [Raoultella terrigena]|uniref:Anaerobic C4-dicarboxylate transporter n=1 Tax=Raoultella terrigena TaxID=577 RepID=A0A4U9CVG8_RAOTE|nr:anaerobic C4-dicarboxylate transporter [Raoultella terrigena]
MILLQFIVVLFFLYLGMRVGGIGVGFAGGAGVMVLCALGATPR